MLRTRLYVALHVLENLLVLVSIVMNLHESGSLLCSHLTCILTLPLPCSLTTAPLDDKNLWVDWHPDQVLMLVIPRLMTGEMELFYGH